MESEPDRIGIGHSEDEKLKTPNRRRDLSAQHAGVQSVGAPVKAYETPNYHAFTSQVSRLAPTELEADQHSRGSSETITAGIRRFLARLRPVGF
jgi:hypothetical protein